jgi:hypothetical protein
VAVAVGALEELKALKDVSLEAVSVLGACQTTTGERTLGRSS